MNDEFARMRQIEDDIRAIADGLDWLGKSAVISVSSDDSHGGPMGLDVSHGRHGAEVNRVLADMEAHT